MTEQNKILYNRVEMIKSDLIKWRRELHQNPEIGLNVPETAAYIINVLRSSHIEILNETPGYTVIARIRGKNPQNPIGLRADMDALEIPEKNSLS